MGAVKQDRKPDVEGLLSGEARSRLPLAQQLLLYLDPFALLKDASRGPPALRARAVAYNRAMRWMLLAYLRRWAMIAASLFLAIAPAEALAAQSPVFLIPTAAFALGCSIALAVAAVIAAAWLLLGSPHRE
jgi:hypothetical protein